MKGILTLTEMRSGSNWLASLTDSTNLMGISGEWCQEGILGREGRSVEDCVGTLLKLSSTDNGVFAVKLFPKHIYWFNRTFKQDLITYLMGKGHQITLILLTREGRILQAVSAAKARQSAQWSSPARISPSAQWSSPARISPSAQWLSAAGKLSALRKTGRAYYDFQKIARYYVAIGLSYEFWKQYLALRQLPYKHFVYEELTDDPAPYIDFIAKSIGVKEYPHPSTKLRVQRDAQSQKWANQFMEDIKNGKCIEELAFVPKPPGITPRNFFRFLRKRTFGLENNATLF